MSVIKNIQNNNDKKKMFNYMSIKTGNGEKEEVGPYFATVFFPEILSRSAV